MIRGLLFSILIALNAWSATGVRTSFVQLFEWPWNDIAQECEEYLGPVGIAAVQVSPPTEHLVWHGRPWWERYQPVSYQLISRSGTESEFRQMVKRCQQVGVDIYVDVVLNHMTGIESGIGTAGTPFEHYLYEGLYTPSDFHQCGRNQNNDIVNFGDLYELQTCELLNLADLRTGSPRVQKTLAAYLNRLMGMGVKGLRIDAAKHMSSRDLAQIMSRVHGAPYIYQEVIAGTQPDPVSVLDYIGIGDVTLFGYSYQVGRSFLQNNLQEILQLGQGLDSRHAVVFLENHDLQRSEAHFAELLSFQRHPKLYELAQVFMLAWPYGYPRLYSSYRFQDKEAGPPLQTDGFTRPVIDADGSCRAPFLCEHRLPSVAPMVQFRNWTNSDFYLSQFWWNGENRMAFSRGKSGFVAINFSNDEWTQEVSTDVQPGRYCDLLGPHYDWESQTCGQHDIVIDEQHKVSLKLAPMSALVLVDRK